MYEKEQLRTEYDFNLMDIDETKLRTYLLISFIKKLTSFFSSQWLVNKDSYSTGSIT